MIAEDSSLELQLNVLNGVLKVLKVGAIVLDQDEHIILWNDWMAQYSGLAATNILGRSFSELFPELVNGRAHMAVRSALRNNMASLISQTLNKAPFPLFHNLEMRGEEDRMQQAVQVLPIDVPSMPRHCLIQVTDVSLAVARERQLREQAMELQSQIFADGLTGIANRRRFDVHLDSELRRAKRMASPMSLAMIDVDSFKNYNDNYGHQAGDDCLILIAAALTRKLGRPCDLVARYGGEEFIALMPDTNSEGARKLAEEMRMEVSNLAIDHGYSDAATHVTVSIGLLTEIPNQNTAPSHLIGAADRALYQAKRSGRNCVVVYGDSEIQ